jgi:anti-sigma regulatory factor (Ser/Thr protein kinase)
MTAPVVVEITDATSVGEVRRRCAELTGRLGFDEHAVGRAAIVATEVASNLVKHAQPGGRVLITPTERRERLAIELLGVDSGPGIENIAQALRDGYSTNTTPGTGLGAVRRQADEFEVHSTRGAGTVVLARVFDGGGRQRSEPLARAAALDVVALGVPKPGEPVSGDGWAAEHGHDRSWVLVVDGLGHGPDAAHAAQAAIRSFRRHAGSAPAERLQSIHEDLHGTRGAAAAIAEIRHASGGIRYAGLGNIAATVVSASDTSSMISLDGIAGHRAERIREFEYVMPSDALLIMHSDGVNQHWDLGRHPGLRQRDPGIVAAVLLRDHARSRDDATVLVARRAPPPDVARPQRPE